MAATTIAVIANWVFTGQPQSAVQVAAKAFQVTSLQAAGLIFIPVVIGALICAAICYRNISCQQQKDAIEKLDGAGE